jgi:hypothetical protein
MRKKSYVHTEVGFFELQLAPAGLIWNQLLAFVILQKRIG